MLLRPLFQWKPKDICDVENEGMGNVIPIKMKTRKWNSCQNGTTVKHGWILLLEKEPLTYMGKESPLYNIKMKKPRYGRNMILLI